MPAAAPAKMADVVAETVSDQKPICDRELNGEADDKEETDPVEETARKKKKKKKKTKSATTGEAVPDSFVLTGLTLATFSNDKDGNVGNVPSK